MPESQLNRRGFLKVLGTAVAAGVSATATFGESPPSTAIVVDPNDPVAAAAPAK